MIIKFYLTCTFLCAISITKAQDAAYLNEAGNLFLQKRYFEASIAYERVLFASDNPKSRYNAIDKKVQCLKQQREYTQAVHFIKTYLNELLPDSIRYKLYNEQLICNYLSGSFENALSMIEQINIYFPQQKPDTKMLLIKILSLNELRLWHLAEEAYAAFLQEINSANTIANPYVSLPHLKNKGTAQWLATFIPGAGQFYAGRPLEALLSIAIQVASIYFGIISFQQRYYLSAWLAGAGLFGSFHMGGVRRSESLVDQYNRKKVYQFNQKVKELLLNLSENER